jgi:hypothetical protein
MFLNGSVTIFSKVGLELTTRLVHDMAAYINIHIPSRLAIAIITKGIANTHKAYSQWEYF